MDKLQNTEQKKHSSQPLSRNDPQFDCADMANMQLDPIYLTIEKQVIADMSIHRLTRKIKTMENVARENNAKWNKRLVKIVCEIERLNCKRLRNKFSLDHHSGILSPSNKCPSSKPRHRNSGKAKISVCDIIKNERYISNLIIEINKINTMKYDDMMQIANLSAKLEECQRYAAQHIPFI